MRDQHAFPRLKSALLIAVVLSFPRAAHGGTVTVPIRLDEPFLHRLVVAKVFTSSGEKAELWRDPRGCGHLTLENPTVEARDGRLRVRSTGDARWGAAVGKTCLLRLSWSGLIDVVEEPRLEPDRPIVHFRVVDTELLDAEGRKTVVTSRLWDWIKGYVHPSMESVTVDLYGPVEELRGFLPLILPSAYATTADVTLASVTLADARVEDDALVIDVALASPDPPPGTQTAPEPPLDVREVEQWDAFLTFVVKRAALDIRDADLRTALLAALLDSRYDIVDALMTAEPGARDPVPRLFEQAWTRLAPVLRRMDADLPGSAAVRYLAFVAAGDALLAIERLGPGSGLDISADGLRRLARMLAPDEERDPLEYATVVDPELRARLGFGPPLPLPASPPPEPAAPATTTSGAAPQTTTTTTTINLAPDLPERPAGPANAPDSSAPSNRHDELEGDHEPASPRPVGSVTAPSSPGPAPEAAPQAPSGSPPAADMPKPEQSPPASPPTTLGREPGPTSRTGSEPAAENPSSGVLSWLLEWLVPAAEAAGEPRDDVKARLRNWAPTRKDLDEYLPIVRDVLRAAAEDTLASKPVKAPYAAVFRPLVLATAWKETCWRQYVRRGGKIVTMQSSAGALGIMQINPRVWRGFYDTAALRADTVYNAKAGAEILQHYFVDYAVAKREHELGGGVDALARATYAAYNGGPGHLGRYRSTKTSKTLRAIDAEFWRVYRIVKGGDELAVRTCFGP